MIVGGVMYVENFGGYIFLFCGMKIWFMLSGVNLVIFWLSVCGYWLRFLLGVNCFGLMKIEMMICLYFFLVVEIKFKCFW